MKAQPSTIFLPNPIQDATYTKPIGSVNTISTGPLGTPVQYSNMRNAAFSIVIPEFKIARLMVFKTGCLEVRQKRSEELAAILWE